MTNEIFKTTFYISEPNIYGEYVLDPYDYVLNTDHKPTWEDICNVIYQACVIERIYKGNLYIEMIIEKDDEYHDKEEFEVEIQIKLLEELSDYINWEVCKSLPAIYKIDKKESTIKVID